MSKTTKILMGVTVLLLVTAGVLVSRQEQTFGIAPSQKQTDKTAIYGWDNTNARWRAFVSDDAGNLSVSTTIGHFPVGSTVTSTDVFRVSSFEDNIDELDGMVTVANIFGRISDGTVRPVELDDSTHVISTITYEHHEIHGGSSYFFTTSSDIGAGDSLDVLIDTNTTSDKWPHLIFEVSSERETEFYLYEDTIVSASGTLGNRFNRNRNSSNSSQTLMYGSPTITSVGTELEMETLGSGRSIGGGTRGEEEIVLKGSGSYLLRATNSSASAGWITVKLDYYEHTDKN